MTLQTWLLFRGTELAVVLGVGSVVIELAALSRYVAACRVPRRPARLPGLAPWLRRTGGVLLAGAGAQLAAVRRS